MSEKFELTNHGELNCTYKCTSNNHMEYDEYYCRGDELDDNEKSEKIKKIVEYEEEAKGMLNELMNKGNEEEVAEKREKIISFLEYLNEFGVDDSPEIINEEYENMKA